MKAALIALALVGATAVQAAPAGSFRQAGYTVEMERYGKELVLTGVNPKTNAKFTLKVDAANRVTGTFNGQPVDFVVGKNGRVQTASLSGN